MFETTCTISQRAVKSAIWSQFDKQVVHGEREKKVLRAEEDRKEGGERKTDFKSCYYYVGQNEA